MTLKESYSSHAIFVSLLFLYIIISTTWAYRYICIPSFVKLGV